MVTCSRCGNEGHNRLNKNCPLLVPYQQQPQQQQPQQPLLPPLPIYQPLQVRDGMIFGFAFCTETAVELNSDLYDRVLIGKHFFMNDFIHAMDDNETNDDKRVFLIRIKNKTNNKTIIANVGGAHREYEHNSVFAPTWMLEALNIHQMGEIEWEKVVEPPPRATKLTLKPIDELWGTIDGREEIEEHLKNFNVLQEGVMLQIPLRPFDNFLASVYVEKIEPAGTVLLRNEVELELLESVVEADIPPEQPKIPVWNPELQPSAPPSSPAFSADQKGQQQPPSMPAEQQPKQQQDRRRLQAEAAERRLAALAKEANSANAASNE